jgi:hypothetical protein
MQKKIIALAVAGLASGAALAQTNVTIYGIADAAYVYSSGDPGNTRGVAGSPGVGINGTNTFSGIQSGMLSGSRLGFKGEEALGNGLKAVSRLSTRWPSTTIPASAAPATSMPASSSSASPATNSVPPRSVVSTPLATKRKSTMTPLPAPPSRPFHFSAPRPATASRAAATRAGTTPSPTPRPTGAALPPRQSTASAKTAVVATTTPAPATTASSVSAVTTPMAA